MTEELQTVKTFVREDDTATIVCPACKRPKNASVASFKNKCHILKVRCPCGNSFKVHLDFRRHYRKDTNLPGIYKVLETGDGGNMMVKDISQSGIGIQVQGVHSIDQGNTLRVSFELDNKRKTKLDKRVTVQSVEGDFIGCKFIEEQAYEKELGFYLKS